MVYCETHRLKRYAYKLLTKSPRPRRGASEGYVSPSGYRLCTTCKHRSQPIPGQWTKVGELNHLDPSGKASVFSPFHEGTQRAVASSPWTNTHEFLLAVSTDVATAFFQGSENTNLVSVSTQKEHSFSNCRRTRSCRQRLKETPARGRGS